MCVNYILLLGVGVKKRFNIKYLREIIILIIIITCIITMCINFNINVLYFMIIATIGNVATISTIIDHEKLNKSNKNYNYNYQNEIIYSDSESVI